MIGSGLAQLRTQPPLHCSKGPLASVASSVGRRNSPAGTSSLPAITRCCSPESVNLPVSGGPAHSSPTRPARQYERFETICNRRVASRRQTRVASLNRPRIGGLRRGRTCSPGGHADEEAAIGSIAASSLGAELRRCLPRPSRRRRSWGHLRSSRPRGSGGSRSIGRRAGRPIPPIRSPWRSPSGWR